MIDIKEVHEFIFDEADKLNEENTKKLRDLVHSKYGDEGIKIFEEQFNPNDEESCDELVDDSDCEDCGKISEDVMKDLKHNLEVLNDCTNDSLSDICNELIKRSFGKMIYLEDVKNEIIKQRPEYTLSSIPDSLVVAVQRRILYHGIVNGWLMDQQFAYSYEDYAFVPAVDLETENEKEGEV